MDNLVRLADAGSLLHRPLGEDVTAPTTRAEMTTDELGGGTVPTHSTPEKDSELEEGIVGSHPGAPRPRPGSLDTGNPSLTAVPSHEEPLVEGVDLSRVPPPLSIGAWFLRYPAAWLREGRNLCRKIWNDSYALLLIVAVGAYSLAWSWLTVSKFYALSDSVWDLGVVMQELWTFVHPGLMPPLSYVELALNTPVLFLVSPLSLADSYPLLLVFQTLALAFGAFPLYSIARRVLRTRPAPLLICLAYLVYFPLAGVNWFDIHPDALLVPLFLIGYLQYVRHRYISAVVLLVLAGAVLFPYLGLIVLFALLLLVETLFRSMRGAATLGRDHLRFALTLLLVSSLLLVYQFAYATYFLGPSGFGTIIHQENAAQPLSAELAVPLLILAPLLFLPFFSPRWLAMLSPFAYLVFFAGSWRYTYPYIFHTQYSVLFIPFVFIGTIQGLARVSSWYATRTRTVVTDGRSTTTTRIRAPSTEVHLGVLVLLATIACAAVLQPYGPLNGSIEYSFDLESATTINWTEFNDLEDLVHLIPSADPYVLVQNEMPEIFPRETTTGPPPILTATINQWYNCTEYDVDHNSFPLVEDGRLFFTPIDYALANTNDPQFMTPSTGTAFSTNISMFTFVTVLSDSGHYGVLGEAGGLVLLARGFTGSTEVFGPWVETFSASELYHWPAGNASGSPIISGANLSGEPLWYGPYTFLLPGSYDVAFSLMTDDNASQNRIDLSLEANGGRSPLNGKGFELEGGNFTELRAWTVFHLSLLVNETAVQVEFRGMSTYWTGELSIRWVQVTMVGPPVPDDST